MTEQNVNYSKRAVFIPGEQKKFLENMENTLGINTKDLAALAKVHVRSVNDWEREKFSIPLSVVQRLCQKAGSSIPKNIVVKNPSGIP